MWLLPPTLVVSLIVRKRVLVLLFGGGHPAFVRDTFFQSASIVTTCRRRVTSLNRPSLSMPMKTPTVALVRACACIVCMLYPDENARAT